MDPRNVQRLSFRDAVIRQTGSILKTPLLLRFFDKAMECPHCHRQTSPRSNRCVSCGGVIPPAQYLLEESGMVKPAPRSAAAAPVTARNDASSRVAKLGDRFIAFVLDTVVLFGVFAVVDAWIFMRWGTVEGAELKLTAASLLLAGALNALILFAYGWLLEASFGATIGKALVGIRVVRTSQRSPLAASAIRNLLRIVDGLGFYLVGAMVAGCSRCRQRLGDLCAGTAVVEEEFSTARKILALALWMAVLSGAAWAVPRICSGNNAGQHTWYLNQVVVQVGRTENSAYFRVARFRIDIQLASSTGSSTGM
jgi:uncharacterized RDD family membrane protein YckC